MIKLLTDYLALGVLRFLVLLLEILPDRFAFALAKLYVRVIFLLMGRLEEVALRNLEIALPDRSEEERREIFQKSKDVLAENILGFARIPTLSMERINEMCDYREVTETLNQIRKESNGVGILIPTMHFDAFEYLVQIHAIAYRPAAILGRGFGLPRLDRWWNARREKFGHEIFGRSGGYKEILRRLKNGEDVILMCDQNVKRSHAVFANFFGTPAATTKTLAVAAMRSGARILFGSPVKIAPGQIKVTVNEIPHPNEEDGTPEEKILKCTENLHRAFENQILLRPEAWFWIHRRWKTRPEGEPEDFYKKKGS